ncbi:MAG: hypothetical protein VX871_10185 [Pseudomonadota bacterium]|nr:hypothetical protein [Pseudomonadota bacterium]
MDYVSIILSMCIGNTVAWVLAIYTDTGSRRLLFNVIAGSAGAALCGLLLFWMIPPFATAGLLIAGPPCAWAAIAAAHGLLWRFRRGGGQGSSPLA